MIREATLNPMKDRVGLVELGIEVVDIALAHLTGAHIEAPSIVIGLKAHIGQHMRKFAFPAICRRHGIG